MDTTLPPNQTKQKLSKMDVAHQQLCTAIELWFNDKYPISSYTLAYAAYEVIHYYGEKSGKKKRTLILDSKIKRLINMVQKPAHFFKHANKDHARTIEFEHGLTLGLLVYCIFGLLEIVNSMEELEALEFAFIFWVYLYEPEWFGKHSLELSKEIWGPKISPEVKEYYRKLNKYEFMKYALKVWANRKVSK